MVHPVLAGSIDTSMSDADPEVEALDGLPVWFDLGIAHLCLAVIVPGDDTVSAGPVAVLLRPVAVFACSVAVLLASVADSALVHKNQTMLLGT